MIFQDFLTKWNGKYIDFDGVYGNQCMDLMHQYCVEVLGISDGSVLAKDCAKNVYVDFANTKGHELFDQIANTPTGIPQEGDIMFWGNSTYGHVAIFISGDANNFTSLDQNYPTGSFCHPQAHTYANVLGWLRVKGNVSTSLQAELDQCRQDRDRNWNYFTAVCTALGVGANVDAAVAEAKKLVGNDDALVQKDKQLADAQTQINDLKSQLQVVTDNHNALLSQYNDLQSKFNEDTNTIADLTQKMKTLEDQITKPVYSGWKKALIDLINKL